MMPASLPVTREAARVMRDKKRKRGEPPLSMAFLFSA